QICDMSYSSSNILTATYGYSNANNCMINNVPMEILIHIFARLDPISLIYASQVCKLWRHIVRDDACWRQGFIAYFGAPPYKRVASDSWKSEYVLRTHLHRKWEKGRGTVLVFDPKIGALDNIYVNFQNSWMLSGTLNRAMATKSDPATGKTERGFMFGHEDALPMAVSAMKMDSHQIVWGHYSGYITITTKTMSTNGRNLKRLVDFHDGPVTALATSPSLHSAVVSGGHDAIVKIWNISTGRCVANLLGARSEIVKLLVDSRRRIIAGCADGSVLSWNLDAVTIMAEARMTNGNRLAYDIPEERPAPYSQFPDVGIAPPTAEVRVKDILYDDVREFVVVHYTDSQKIFKHEITTGKCLAVFENPSSTAKVTCIQWDKEIESTTEEEVGKAGTDKRQTRHRTDIIAASNFSVLTSDEQLATPTIRVLVSGDENGNLCLFNMDAEPVLSKPVIPLISIQGHHTAISAIHIDACKIVTGSNDGWIKIWDPISGENIKILHNKIPRNAPIDRSDIDLFAVKSIVCTDYIGVAAIGNQIKTWDFSPDKQLLSRRKLRPKKSNTGNIHGTRGQLQAEIHKEVRESRTRLAEERKAMEEATKTIQKMTLGLSEQECLDYALMLSAEASAQGSPSTVPQASPAPAPGNDAAPPDDEDEALLQAVIASLETAKKEEENSVKDEENPSSSYEHFSDAKSINYYEDEDVEKTMEDSWPSIRTASKRASNPAVVPLSPELSTAPSTTARYNEQEFIDDEDDEELQYVLKLSMGQV
ncbi:hypothetical protein INT43_004549, partial [Umbelopsis isabellina]